jgi:hypothetical protein
MSANTLSKRCQTEAMGYGIRAYVAPVDRVNGVPTVFDPGSQGQFDLDSPPSPWVDVGWVENFQRNAATKYEALRSGATGNITVQYRTLPEARLEFDLLSWGKLQMALAGGSQQMNVLAETPLGTPQGSGGAAMPASPVQNGSTATSLVLTADQLSNYNAGDMVAVDVDYTGATGYVGTGAAAAYLVIPLDPSRHVDFVRRVTFNVSRVVGKTGTALMLGQPLIGKPTTGMGVQKVMAFLDREGSSFLQEWSGLFIVATESGGRVCFYYPRLQPSASGMETRKELAAPLFGNMLYANLRALPTNDANNGETVLCYRSYFPAATAAVY